MDLPAFLMISDIDCLKLLAITIGVTGLCHEYLVYLKWKSDRVVAQGNPPPIYWTGDLAMIIRSVGRAMFFILIALALLNLKRWGHNWPNN